MECLCVKCLNFSHIIDALKTIGLNVPWRALLNVLTSICPILVDKEKFGLLSTNNSSKIKIPVQKKSAITFGSIKEVEFTSKSLCVKTKCIMKFENNTREIKHDPNKYLMDVNNVPCDLSVESVILYSDPSCMFRECDMCGVNVLNSQLIAQNHNIQHM